MPLSQALEDQRKKELVGILENSYVAIVRVRPDEDACWILKGGSPRHIYRRLPYSSTLRMMCKLVYTQYRTRLLYVLGLANLETTAVGGDQFFAFGGIAFGQERWIAVNVIKNETTKDIYLLFKKCREHDVVLKDVVNMYVYERCDYFIYLDAARNSYVMFSGSSSGTPLPPQTCEDYEEEIVKYADLYISPEDRSMVIAEMRVERVLEVLSKKATHSFYAGVIDPIRGYTRKKFEYRYYNQETRKILLWRTDVSELYYEEMARNAKLREALQRAQTDSMTGLYNRQTIKEYIVNSLGGDQGLCALLFIDIDNFKSINDIYGHVMGDRAIMEISSILKDACKSDHGYKTNCVAGRLGGDEFVIFARQLSDKTGAIVLAQEVCDAIYALHMRLGCTISCSVGIAFAPLDALDHASLMEIADARVYRVKSTGKNGICWSDTVHPTPCRS